MNAFAQRPAGLTASKAQPEGQRAGIGYPADLPGSFEPQGTAAIFACDRGGEARHALENIAQNSHIPNPTGRAAQTLPCVITQACIAKLLPALAADESARGGGERNNQTKEGCLEPPCTGIILAGIKMGVRCRPR